MNTLTKIATVVTGSANQSPAVKKHIQTQQSNAVTGSANKSPAVKKHIQKNT